MKKIALLLVLTLCVQLTFAQMQTVKGNVVDAAGIPVIGATIKVAGTQLGATTDLNGNFTIKDVPQDAAIIISFIGMKTQNVKAASNLNIQMQDDAKMLDEVVAIGYGSAKAKDLTSPIAVVKGSELTSTPSSSPMSALQGKVPGVNVVNSGAPGSGYSENTR